MLTKESLESVVAKVTIEAGRISAKNDHRDWYPCGFVWITCKGNSALARAIKKHKPVGIDMHDGYPSGKHIHVRFPARDAYESQSMRYSIEVLNFAVAELKKLGCDEIYVDSRID